MRVVHLVDPTTGDDAFSMLTMLLERAAPEQRQHHILLYGNVSLEKCFGNTPRTRADAPVGPGVAPGSPASVKFIRNIAALDPHAWHAVGKTCAPLNPDIFHAWGVPSMLAAGMQGGCGAVATLAAPLPQRQWNTVRSLLMRPNRPMFLVTNSKALHHLALSHGVPAQTTTVINQGIAMGGVGGDADARANLRRRLGLDAAAGPIICLPPPYVPAARHDHGLWAAGILREILPGSRVILPPAPAGPHGAPARHALRRTAHFANHLSHPDMVLMPPNFTWQDILAVSDICLCAADGPIPTGAILQAMAAGVPLVATAIACIAEIAENQFNALLSPPGQPRALAARLEELAADPSLASPLVDKARREIFMHHKPRVMVEQYDALYARAQTSVGTSATEAQT